MYSNIINKNSKENKTDNNIINNHFYVGKSLKSKEKTLKYPI